MDRFSSSRPPKSVVTGRRSSGGVRGQHATEGETVRTTKAPSSTTASYTNRQPIARGNYKKISYVAIVVLDRETSNQVRMWLGKNILTPRSEKKKVLNILIGRYIVHFLVTDK